MVKSEGMRQLLTRTGEAVQGATCISIHLREFPLPKVIVIVLFLVHVSHMISPLRLIAPFERQVQVYAFSYYDFLICISSKIKVNIRPVLAHAHAFF